MRVKSLFAGILAITTLVSCAAVSPKLAPGVAQPDNAAVRNFTSFSDSLRCMDDLLTRAGKPRSILSSTGFPDLTKKVTVGADEMLINAINRLNRKSKSYAFLDQALEKEVGQIALLTRRKEEAVPDLYIRGAITQLDDGVVSDTASLGFDLSNVPLGDSLIAPEIDPSRKVSIVSVDMHLVSYPEKIVMPGLSVANSMVVVQSGFGFSGSGLINLTGLDFTLKINRIESRGQAVRNLIELGVIELLGIHSRVPYWQCLKIDSTDPRYTKKKQKAFAASAPPVNVTEVQELLRRLRYLSAAPTGHPDLETKKAVSRFQADENLIATGAIDYDLLSRLREKAEGYPGFSASHPGPKKDRTDGFFLSLKPEKQTYKTGDILRLAMDIQRNGYISCFHQSGAGDILRILPHSGGQRIKVTKQSKLTVPLAHAPFDITFEISGISESILCIHEPGSRPAPLPKILRETDLAPLQVSSFKALVEAYRQRAPDIETVEFGASPKG